MANLNKVMLIGRLTRDPEFRAFATGGRVCKLGFAVSNRKKNAQTGEWEDDPMFIDCDVFNRDTYKQADLIERFGLHKGSQIFIEGRLILDRWDDKTSGEKRSKHKIVVDNFQLLDRKEDGTGGSAGAPRAADPARSATPAESAPEYENAPAPTGGGNGDIPF